MKRTFRKDVHNNVIVSIFYIHAFPVWNLGVLTHLLNVRGEICKPRSVDAGEATVDDFPKKCCL